MTRTIYKRTLKLIQYFSCIILLGTPLFAQNGPMNEDVFFLETPINSDYSFCTIAFLPKIEELGDIEKIFSEVGFFAVAYDTENQKYIYEIAVNGKNEVKNIEKILEEYDIPGLSFVFENGASILTTVWGRAIRSDSAAISLNELRLNVVQNGKEIPTGKKGRDFLNEIGMSGKFEIYLLTDEKNYYQPIYRIFKDAPKISVKRLDTALEKMYQCIHGDGKRIGDTFFSKIAGEKGELLCAIRFSSAVLDKIEINSSLEGVENLGIYYNTYNKQHSYRILMKEPKKFKSMEMLELMKTLRKIPVSFEFDDNNIKRMKIIGYTTDSKGNISLEIAPNKLSNADLLNIFMSSKSLNINFDTQDIPVIKNLSLKGYSDANKELLSCQNNP